MHHPTDKQAFAHLIMVVDEGMRQNLEREDKLSVSHSIEDNLKNIEDYIESMD